MATTARSFNEEFFPTPSGVVYKMLAKVSEDAKFFLEPSAGKGHIADVIESSRRRYGGSDGKIDCIELDPDLISILREKKYPVVGFDWLTYTGVCYYDAIVMNPPFSDGVRHLLRAWDFMHDGEIVCLLNAESINNPYTQERRLLADIIQKFGDVEFLGDCFRLGERTTGVQVAMVKLTKAANDDRIEAWSTGTAEKELDVQMPEESMLAIKDELGNMEHYYNQANEHMLLAIHHARKSALYMQANSITDTSDLKEALGLALKNINSARSEFTSHHRKAAWMRVFNRMQFHKWLDKKQREEFLRDVEADANVPFTADNIKGTLDNIMLHRRKFFEQSVSNVFDSLTKFHNENTVYKEGWKTNDEYKVNERVVFPYGCRHESSGGFNWGFNLINSHSEIDCYNDLDRVLCVLDGKKFEECVRVETALRYAFQKTKEPGKCESEYFEIRFFKKGTIHLKWKRLDLWEKFNVTAAAGKKWIGRSTQ